MNSFINSLKKTLIDENRYQLYINGIVNTVIISFVSIFLGLVLAIILFAIRKSKKKPLKLVAKIYIKIMQGIPITVLLLIFYYVVFANININAMIVAIIVFSLYFSVYAEEVIRASFESINQNQIDSSLSLGFTPFQTIKYIIFPQMLVSMIPPLKNECVSIIKLTSIVGYISIMDLTRASDIIRNRTYEAFLPLLFSAFIYYLICLFVIKILDLIYKKINPLKELNSK